MERREPIIEEEQPEPEPQPETASAGGVRPPGRIGGGLRDDDGGEEPPPPSGPVPGWFSLDPRSLPIEDLNLSMRGYNVLRRNKIFRVGQVLDMTEEELLGLRNLGRRAYDELRQRLDELRIMPSDKPWDVWRTRWKGSWKSSERP